MAAKADIHSHPPVSMNGFRRSDDRSRHAISIMVTAITPSSRGNMRLRVLAHSGPITYHVRTPKESLVARRAVHRTMSDNDRIGRDDRQTGVVVKSKPKTKKPSMYKVLLLNDDYTPMEFVVH